MIAYQFCPLPLSSGAMTLVGGSNFTHGRLRLFYEGQWGTVCFKGANLNTAALVCRQLGFPNAIDVAATLLQQENLTYWLELTLLECLHDQFTTRIEQCNHAGWRQAPHCAGSVLDYNFLCASK